MSRGRIERVSEEMRQLLSEILHHHLADPRLAWVSIIRVEMSKDLRYARVFISVLGDEATQAASLRVLHRATPAVRAELARRLRVRKLPEIVFRADRSIGASLEIARILRELGFSEDEEPSNEPEESGEKGS